MHPSFDQRIWFMVIFFPLKKNSFCSKYEIFLLNCHIAFPSFCYHGQNYENAPTILMENYHQVICLDLSILFLYATPNHVWLFEKFIFELKAF